MQFKPLGRTDIKVSEICLGTMTWGRQNTAEEGHEQIAYAKQAGINFMDTAEMYAVPIQPETYGKTEEIIGNWFAANKDRDQWILASKVAGGGTKWIREGQALCRQSILEAVEGSLKRLKTDYIDLYQLHWPVRGSYNFENYWRFDPTQADRAKVADNMLEVLQTLDEIVKQGKVRHIGVSNETAWGMMKYLSLADQHNLPRLQSVQNEYSLIRRIADHDVAEVCHHENISFLAYSPLGAGVLSGKYMDGAMPPGTRGAIIGGLYRQNSYSAPAIRCYLNLAADHGLDVNQMALAYALQKPFMTSVIIGATSMDQLRTDIAAADVTLDDNVKRGIDSVHRLYPRPV